ncbi:MarR family winged helix-turn-helix transcriptional regulator [uncultured Robinsoniella sp.]|uniref:MarR family winged helix-turn-helix transcriptional regulator n=1 Tax=uncultured Robinsoniella sp. TaxID=904190 RepID=UPI00374F0234
MSEKNLKEEFMRVSHRMRRLNMSHVFSDVSQGEFFALEMLRKFQQRNGDSRGVIVSDLARSLRVSPPAASRTLKNMEEKGLIRREVDKNNRRNTYVYLTEKGMESRDMASKAMEDFTGRIMKRMGDENVEMLISLIQKMTTIMEEELADKGKGDKDEETL